MHAAPDQIVPGVAQADLPVLSVRVERDCGKALMRRRHTRLPTLRSTVPPKYTGSGITRTSFPCSPFAKQSTKASFIKRIGP